MQIYCSYYHIILYHDFEMFHFCGGILFVIIRIKGMVCKKVQGKKELKTKQLTFARPRPARVLSGFGRGSGLGKAGWEKPWTPGDGLGRVSTTSSISVSELLFSERVVLSRLTMPHSAWFLLDCWKAFISFVKFGFGSFLVSEPKTSSSDVGHESTPGLLENL